MEPPVQAGFCQIYNTTDHIFTLNKLLESVKEYNIPLLFIDYEKAIRSVEINAVLQALAEEDKDEGSVSLIKEANTGCSIDIKLSISPFRNCHPSFICLPRGDIPRNKWEGGGHYEQSGKAVSRAPIIPWSRYSAINNITNSQEFPQKLSTPSQLFVLKGVREKMASVNLINNYSIPNVIKLPPNSYFRHRGTSLGNYTAKFTVDSDNRNLWTMNHFPRKNQSHPYTTATVKHRMIPRIPKSWHNQITVPRTDIQTYPVWKPPEQQLIHLYAANTFDHSTPVIKNVVRSMPSFHVSRLGTAPALSILPTSNNIVDAILAQSQSGLTPLTAPVIGMDQNVLTDSVAALLSSRKTVESLAKFARNLLTLQIPSQPEMLLSLTSGVKNSAAPSNAAIETPVEPSSNIINTQQIFANLAKKDLPVKNDANISFENETEIFLRTMPEEQRSLLRAAIQSGELDAHSLQLAIGDASSKKTIKKQNKEKLMEWIQQNRKKIINEVQVSAERLPYYGKYCGSFTGQTGNRFNAAGAVWAVDNRRFIVSKFQFNPGTLLTENVTFWAGPNERTDDSVADMTPSANGFYLKPQSISLTVFHKPSAKVVEAHIRKQLNSRKRRDLFTELYEPYAIQAFHELVNGVNKTYNSLTGTIMANDQIYIRNNLTHSSDVNISNGNEFVDTTEKTTVVNENNNMEALGWYAGFKPLLFTLPDNKLVKTTSWFALRDHKNQDIVVYVLIPNGPAFKIPEVVQLRGLTSSDLYEVSSKYIKVHDTKTIEVNNFNYKSNGLAAWFVVGKDILPNSNGHIVPLYNRSDNSFDCDSLRDYANETVILKLPGHLDIKDVFWFSVFSMEEGISLSHIYLPYNDMHLPPDLTDITTPKCVIGE